MKTRVMLIALGVAGFTLFGTSVNESAAPVAVERVISILPAATTAATTGRTIAALPTVTASDRSQETADPSEAFSPRAGYAAASLPSLDPQRSIAALPTVASTPEPEPERTSCDPAYPDTRTCIPPGPPFDQGCAITEERLFTVLAPDPQRLDHDKDGIGCEPVGGGA